MTDTPTFEGDMSWAHRGACVGHTHPEWWFPGEADRSASADYHMARAVCDTCPVITQCRAHGLEHETQGMWGGLTPKERQRKLCGENINRGPASSKGRSKKRALTVEQELEVVREYGVTSQKELAERFGVARTTIYRIVTEYRLVSTGNPACDPQGDASSVAISQDMAVPGQCANTPRPEQPTRGVTR